MVTRPGCKRKLWNQQKLELEYSLGKTKMEEIKDEVENRKLEWMK